RRTGSGAGSAAGGRVCRAAVRSPPGRAECGDGRPRRALPSFPEDSTRVIDTGRNRSVAWPRLPAEGKGGEVAETRPEIDGERLLGDLEALARIGATPQGGVNRIAFSPADLEARQWV